MKVDPLAELAMEYALESFDPEIDRECHLLKRYTMICFVGIGEALAAIDEAFEALKLIGLHK